MDSNVCGDRTESVGTSGIIVNVLEWQEQVEHSMYCLLVLSKGQCKYPT